jgi:flagellar FliL protein
MQRILPVLIVLFGLAAGTGAGYLLRPEAAPVADDMGAAGDAATPDGADSHGVRDHGDAGHGGDDHGAAAGQYEYAKLNNQFVVPVVRDGAVTAIIVMSLSIETAPGTLETVYALEPKLRDAFLQVLFDHANAGGFDGNFTADASLGALRTGLREAARAVLGPDVNDVLMLDILRQDN